jgi:acetyltransferase-like isoleucine patch superfamily enzyme
MKNKIYSLLKKILGKSNNVTAKAQYHQYEINGNLKVGKNSDISALNIHIAGAKAGFVNIEIGDDCLLSGNISLFSPEAKVSIGDRCFIGPNSTLFVREKIQIENDVMISWNCTLIDTNAHSLIAKERSNDVLAWKKGWEFKDWSKVESKSILIEKSCWIGFNSSILKGVTVSEGCVVAAGSVVTKSFQPYLIIGGNPAVEISKTQ